MDVIRTQCAERVRLVQKLTNICHCKLDINQRPVIVTHCESRMVAKWRRGKEDTVVFPENFRNYSGVSGGFSVAVTKQKSSGFVSATVPHVLVKYILVPPCKF
jgi:hypothetical protein